MRQPNVSRAPPRSSSVLRVDLLGLQGCPSICQNRSIKAVLSLIRHWRQNGHRERRNGFVADTVATVNN
jgi:hypothetical protein